MKCKTTKKEVTRNYSTILKVGYCDLQNLLNYENAFAYSAGASGWACDYYDVNGACISTGYAPIGVSVDYEIRKKYDTLSEKIRYDYSKTWEQQRDEIKELLKQFIKEATTGKI